MGNGYTFELESCIFAAICAECLSIRGHEAKLGEDLFVFGDDIIVPIDSADLVVSTLRWLGFETNNEKSFLKGPFRESCGGDFFNGTPVRGFYLKTALSKVNLLTLFSLHNGAKRVLEGCAIDSAPFLDYLISLLPPRLRTIGGSDRLGDTVLHGRDPKFKWKDSIKWVKAVRWTSPVLTSWSYFSDEARLACRLTGYGDTFGINSRGVRQNLELIWVTDS
jgi:hypothetical protein